jgi:quercetin dioxygenase-like cupin family protein
MENDVHLVPKPPTTKNPPEQFTGDVYLDPIAWPQNDGQHMTVAKVRFLPGARTAWHSHPNGQTLHVTEGVGLVQSRGGEILEIRAGDTIYTPPGEEHWHGATPDHYMEHLAMLEVGTDADVPAGWGDHVTDEEYNGPRRHRG